LRRPNNSGGALRPARFYDGLLPFALTGARVAPRQRSILRSVPNS